MGKEWRDKHGIVVRDPKGAPGKLDRVLAEEKWAGPHTGLKVKRLSDEPPTQTREEL